MKLEFRRDPDAQEIRVCIVARQRNEEVEEIIRRLQAPKTILAYDDRGETPLEMGEIIRIYTQQRRVMVDSDRGTYTLRSRMYELEEELDGHEFVRISNSEIVNRSRILHLDFSLAGTIRLKLKGGTETYVSRRYVKRIRRIFESRGA